MAMDNSLIGLVNRIQRVCTALGDFGGGEAVASLWESLPSVAVVGGQVLSLETSQFDKTPPLIKCHLERRLAEFQWAVIKTLNGGDEAQ